MPVDDRRPLVDDPELRGGDVVLAPAALEEWLSDTLGRPCHVEPRRLRYKAGTSAVLAFDLTTEDRGAPTTEACVARTYAAHASAKLEKARHRLPPPALVAHDDARLTLVTTAAGDRAVPLLPRLGRPDALHRLTARLLPGTTGAAATRTIRHNPGRRWVGTLERRDQPTVLLRAYDGAATMARAAACYRSLAGSDTATPQLVGRSRSWAVLAVTWIDGVDLGHTPDRPDLWRAAGRGLARLHDSPGGGLSHPAPHAELDAVRAAGRQVADLVPEVADVALEVARVTARELVHLPGGAVVAIHGDYSPDQVVSGPGGLSALIDLDAARLGDAAHDLGCLTASAMVCAGDATRGRAQLAAFLSGYDEVRPPPAASAVALHAVAFRLRKAVDPFRECAPDWRAQVVRRVLDARSALDDVALVGRSGRWA